MLTSPRLASSCRGCLLLVICVLAACGSTSRGRPGIGGGGVDASVPGGPCAEGGQRCNGKDLEVCRMGEFLTLQNCAEECDQTLGCVACKPGQSACVGMDQVSVCRDDGSAFDLLPCDPVQGASCEIDSGQCVGPCAPQNIKRAYIGCEYYPTITGNEVDGNFLFAVAVSSASQDEATITIDGGELGAPLVFPLAPGAVVVKTLPWVVALKGCMSNGQQECGGTQVPAALVRGGSYRLRSTQPVTVYQFNPLDYQLKGGSQFSYTNDASLLLPVNALRSDYLVASWPVWSNGQAFPGLMAVTATLDDTTVTITTATATQKGGGAPAFAKGVPGNVTLNRGDVIELFTYSGDLTGSRVTSDKPVQVIGGHFCTQVPIGTQACDHMEESMFPVETLSTKYIVTAPAVPSLPNGKIEVIRVIATVDNTTLEYDPPQKNAKTVIAKAGGFIEIAATAADFQITADHKIVVAQYMAGQEAGGNAGDPAMTLAVPVDQYRRSYLIHAPVNYEQQYINITAPDGAQIELDGKTVSGFKPIGGSGYGFVRKSVASGGNGNHNLTGDAPFGITVYGYGQYTSYWYPGGLDLESIPIQ